MLLQRWGQQQLRFFSWCRQGWLRHALLASFGLVTQLRCPVCDAPAWDCCDTCLQPGAPPALLFSPRHGARLQPQNLSPPFARPMWPPVWYGASYEGPWQQVIHRWKEQGQRRLTWILARSLSHSLLGGLVVGLWPGCPQPPRLEIVPVPATAAAHSRRGWRHTWDLARALCIILNSVGFSAILRQSVIAVGRREDQATLSRQERQHNMQAAFRVAVNAATPSRATNFRVLVDDVLTTGATLQAVAQPLAEAGQAPQIGLVLAAAA